MPQTTLAFAGALALSYAPLATAAPHFCGAAHFGGASRGIGRSVAHAFAREGAQLFLVGHVDQKALDDAVRIVREAGACVQASLFDVGSHVDVCRIAERITAQFGTLDIVVNNAGTISPAPLLEITLEQWERVVRTHLFGTFYVTVEMVRRVSGAQALRQNHQCDRAVGN